MLAWLVLLTVVWRMVLALRTPVPAEDGVSYLWMAQQFAAGDFAAGLAAVFPPGFPLLLAPLLWCGLDPFVVGQWFGAVCAGLTLLPLAAMGKRVAPGSEVALGLLWASASLLARNAVEVYSEPPFLLAMALGTQAGLQGRWWRLGGFAALAFWIRPEGLLLAGAFLLSHGRPALRAWLPAAAGVLALALVRWLAGHGFDPLPIHGFHELRDDLPMRGDLLANLLDVPAAWFEAFGPLGLLVLLAGRVARGRGAAALGGQIALQIAVVCTFVVRRRFFLSCAVPVFLLAVQVLQALRPRWRHGFVAVAAGIGLVGAWTGVIDGDRLAERRLGEYLGARLLPGQTLTGDLTRVVYFAGRAPLPPRRFDAEQLLAMAAPDAVQFVAVGIHRDTYAGLAAGLAPRFVPLPLPPELAGLTAARGIAVFTRR